MSLLHVKGLHKSFGGIVAVKNYEIALPAGSIYGLIGPNGAGKTTVINVLTGIIGPDAGRVIFDGRDITRRGPDDIARLGIARTFQNIRIFKNMSVKDNVLVAAQLGSQYTLPDALLALRKYKKEEADASQLVDDLAGLLGLQRLVNYTASEIPFGTQKRLEIARALALRPRLMLLDEPASGMSAREAEELRDILMTIREEKKLTMLVIEHRVPFVMKLCDRVQVMNQGELIAEGTPEEVKADEQVIKVYLRSGAA